jgi:phosphonopyruvate decarboxylase
MLQVSDFVEPLLKAGYSFWTGVPCSYLTPLINYLINHEKIEYIGAASEGEAVAIACGAHLAGKKSVMICQNSGLGNTVNPISSLIQTFNFEFLMMVSLRGDPLLKDEPQHKLMGEITPSILDQLQIDNEFLPQNKQEASDCLKTFIENSQINPSKKAYIIKKNTFEPVVLESTSVQEEVESSREVKGEFKLNEGRIQRKDAIKTIRDNCNPENAALVASTGKIGRELYALGHRENQFYMVGSMGCASAIGFGLAKSTNSKKNIVILDGDGSALMKLGNLATIGHHNLNNLIHVVLDNEVHDSTGAQATVSRTVDFARVASACGYRHAFRIEDAENLKECLREIMSLKGSKLIHLKIQKGSDPKLGRPTINPVEVKRQFREWMLK